MPRARAQLHVPRAAIQVGDERLRTVQVTVEDGHPLHAGLDEHRHRGPGAATGTEDDRAARPLALHPEEDGDEAGADAVEVAVVAAQLRAVPHHDVDRARRARVVRFPAPHGMPPRNCRRNIPQCGRCMGIATW